MGRKRLVSDLFVYMNNELVGLLSQHVAGQLRFIYDVQWLQKPYARPISLSLPLQEEAYQGEKVYNYFDNLLPDSESVRTRIQKRFGINSNQCFDLLSHIGADCIGALQLLAEPLGENVSTIEGMPLTIPQIAQMLKNYDAAPLGMEIDTDFRISIAGAQEKTALLRYNNHWVLPKHTTPTTHIFKLPIGRIVHSGLDLSDSVENEWLCLQILEAFHLPVNKSEMAVFDGMKVLICERFDREWNIEKSMLLRLPQEDMCQVFALSSALKYESDGGLGIKNIMDFLSGSSMGAVDRMHFFKACFIYWVLGAIDGHAKNFSVFIKSGGRFSLTPFYDVLSAYPLADKKELQWNKLKMAMSVRGKNKHYHWDRILKRHWMEMAHSCGFSTKIVEEMMNDVFDNMETVIHAVSSTLPESFPMSMAESIFKGMRRARNMKFN